MSKQSVPGHLSALGEWPGGKARPKLALQLLECLGSAPHSASAYEKSFINLRKHTRVVKALGGWRRRNIKKAWFRIES